MLLGRRVSLNPATTLLSTTWNTSTIVKMYGPRRFSVDMDSFQEHLKASNRILALLGAGLSASSGLPTFRGAGGLWRNYDAVELATPEAFNADPGLVWQFYSYRRHMALNAKPNPAHYALAELAKKNENFVTLSQNVDGMCKPDKLLYLS
jgi:NAD-dependent SIR2 family protein deacetylase